MKELTIIQKARRYDEALDNARHYHKEMGDDVKCILEECFSELKGSEDERVKSCISMILTDANEKRFNDFHTTLADCLAWLEKQGEQKTAIFIPKFRVGDIVKSKSQPMLTPRKIISISKDCYFCEDRGCIGFAWEDDYVIVKQKSALPKWKYKNDNTPLLRDSLILNKYGCVAQSPSGALVSDVWVIDYDELVKLPKEEIEKQGEQNPADNVEPKFHEGQWIIDSKGTLRHIINVGKEGYQTDGGWLTHDTYEKTFHLWTIEDAKDGDVLVCEGKHGQEIGIVKKYVGKYGGCDTCFETYCFVDWDGIFRVGEYMGSRNIHPATKEQRDTLMKAMADAGYTFDFEKKELKEIEQSKLTEFEDAVKDMMDDYRDAIGDNDATTEEVKKHAAYLLSLIPCKSTEWGEEDSYMLGQAIKCVNNSGKLEVSTEEIEDWLQSIKDRVQPKQEWSEEDEAMYQGVIETEQYMLDVVYGRKAFAVGSESIKEECYKELDWLKDRVKLLTH